MSSRTSQHECHLSLRSPCVLPASLAWLPSCSRLFTALTRPLVRPCWATCFLNGLTQLTGRVAPNLCWPPRVTHLHNACSPEVCMKWKWLIWRSRRVDGLLGWRWGCLGTGGGENGGGSFVPVVSSLPPFTPGVFHKECVITAFVGFSSCNGSSGRPC